MKRIALRRIASPLLYPLSTPGERLCLDPISELPGLKRTLPAEERENFDQVESFEVLYVND